MQKNRIMIQIFNIQAGCQMFLVYSIFYSYIVYPNINALTSYQAFKCQSMYIIYW